MAWLSGFNNRLKLKIDNTKIDDTLSDFPVLIKISNSSGLSSLDVTYVFTELGSDANRKKIAVTISDGTTQCYVEIERFEHSNSVAWLWVRVPSISSGAETILYFYYDSDQVDNTTYIGDVGDTAAQNVWDSNFKLVMHMTQDPNGDVTDAIKDSTSNANHGTSGGTMLTVDLVDGKTGKAIDFDGNDDYINIGDISMDFGVGGLTLETTIKASDSATDREIIFRQDDLNSHNPIVYLKLNSTGHIEFLVRGQTNPASLINITSGGADYDDNTFRYIAGTFDDNNNSGIIWVNSVNDGSNSSKTTTDINFGQAKLQLGRLFQEWIPSDANYFKDIIDEVRISNTARSAAWIKATYYSNWDGLVSFELPLDPDDWSNRFKLTIPADSADSSLTNFPVMINLSSGAGKNNFDATAVFNELGDDHQKRFAITKNDGTTQCPVEIEYWDATEKKAVLWTKIPTVYSSVDTDVFFYFDATASGNTTYIGDVGDTTAQNVWDSNFKLVMHMTQDPNGDVVDAIKDSTSNANHGTPAGSMTSADLVDGKIGKAIDFDGNDDYVVQGLNSGISGDAIFTMSAYFKANSLVAWGTVVGDGDIATALQAVAITTQTNGQIGLSCGGGNVAYIAIGSVGVDTYYDIAITKIAGAMNSTTKVYLDGVDKALVSPSTNTPNIVNTPLKIGDLFANFDGIIGEVRCSNTIRSAAWIKATYYSNWDDFIIFQQEETTLWLSDWKKRIKLTVDKDKIDSTLVDFPINIILDSNTGITNTDVTGVLTTISGGSKKIAITTNDGITQCYVEIERWDEGNEQANLWTKVPSVSSNEDTVLYLYYDSSKSDNTSYVGDTGDTPAQSVWDSNFKLVMHMAQDPNGDVVNAIKDSTSNLNHGTPGGSMTSADLVDGKIGKVIDFDGDNDIIDCGSGSSLNITGDCTVEGCLNLDTLPGASKYPALLTKNTDYTGYQLILYGDCDKIYFQSNDGVSWINSPGSDILSPATYYYVTGVYDGSYLRLYINGTERPSPTSFNTGLPTNGATVKIGPHYSDPATYGYIDSKVDEIRISNTARSAAWIKATYYSNWNNLIIYGSEHGIPTHYYYGYITEDDTPVSRTVRLYYRDTGELVNTTTSSGSNGYYYLTTTVSGEHFIVAFDDDAGTDYNALILDKLLPRGIE